MLAETRLIDYYMQRTQSQHYSPYKFQPCWTGHRLPKCHRQTATGWWTRASAKNFQGGGKQRKKQDRKIAFTYFIRTMYENQGDTDFASAADAHADE